MRFRGGWLRPRLELSGRDLAVFETVPGEDGGIVRLWLSRQDREIAESLASRVNRAIASWMGRFQIEKSTTDNKIDNWQFEIERPLTAMANR